MLPNQLNPLTDTAMILLAMAILFSAMGLLSKPFRKKAESTAPPVLSALHRAQKHYRAKNFTLALEALQAYERMTSVPPDVMADVLHMKGLISLIRGDYQSARSLLQMGYLEAQAGGMTHQIVMLGASLSTALFECEDYEGASAILNSILPIAEDISRKQKSDTWDIKVLAAIYLGLARASQQDGRLSESIKLYETARSYWTGVDYMQETVVEIDRHLVEVGREIIRRQFGAEDKGV